MILLSADLYRPIVKLNYEELRIERGASEEQKLGSRSAFPWQRSILKPDSSFPCC